MILPLTVDTKPDGFDYLRDATGSHIGCVYNCPEDAKAIAHCVNMNQALINALQCCLNQLDAIESAGGCQAASLPLTSTTDCYIAARAILRKAGAL